MVCAEQVHGNRAALVTARDAGRGTTDFTDSIEGVDALVTGEAELMLTLFFADCLPVLLADKENRSIAVAHAGWRGLVGGVLENTLKTMTDQFGSRPESIVAVIGPGIGPCCFEVGPEVAAHFPSSVRHNGTTPEPHVDLPGAAWHRLRQAGIPESQIDSAGICTACATERFFSYRRERGKTGRMAAFIAKLC
jgi:YfiH family protein